MSKIAFMGAGSTVFAKNILGDCLLSPALHDWEFALYDIDAQRLQDSRIMLENLNANINHNRAKIIAHLGPENRRNALAGAKYVINAIQVGGYEPATVTDFEIPKKLGLRQTIADTLGIGGIFRAVRTIPVVLDFARDMEAVCPDAWFLNYVNPMAMITAALLRGSAIRTVGLCHSVQGCANHLLGQLGLKDEAKNLQWHIAGINHQAWLLQISDAGEDLYPRIKQRAAELVANVRRLGRNAIIEQAKASGDPHWGWRPQVRVCSDLVRLEIMRHLGYYLTESSEHTAEYVPWFIKSAQPGLIDEFNIPLDEYPRRCVANIKGWTQLREEIVANKQLGHTRSHEYGSNIIQAMETNVPFQIGGNVMNTGLITNLPAKACVEVPCRVDRGGITPTFVGDLPEQCAALNRTSINPQILTVEAVLLGQKDALYQAAMLDPHTAAELNLDQIRQLCDELIAAHGEMIPEKLR